MIEFDPSQELVLGLDPTEHARVLGAPGTGKTALVVESFARVLARAGWSEGDALVLAPNRLVAARLREQLHARVAKAMGGAPVRTASSFAFSVLGRAAAVAGEAPARLLTGTVQDEAIAEIVLARLAGGSESSNAADEMGTPLPDGPHGRQGSGPSARAGDTLAPEVLLSAPFRAELRELWRVLDDFGYEPSALAAELHRVLEAGAGEAYTAGPDPALAGRWLEALGLLSELQQALALTRGSEVSSSGLLRLAAQAIREGRAEVPKLLIVDDAQELGEGQLALIAACASVGSAVWVFGDPDLATSAFQGEHTRVLAGLSAELGRRGWVATPGAVEQLVVLTRVYRHGAEIRGFVRELSGKIGASGTGEQRAAESAGAAGAGAEASGSVEFARVATPAEQLGAVAHRMRARKLGLDTGRVLEWGDMAVVCRTRSEVTRVARLLAGHQVPTGVAAGGIVLREHQIVRELVALLQHALGIAPLDAAGVLRLAGGVTGGLDPVAVRRLRGALLLDERRLAREEGREPASVDEVLFEAFEFPGPSPAIDSAGGRAIRRLGLMAAAGTRVHDNGGTPREVLWALWDAAKLAARWQEEAISGRGLRADEANRSLDAVVGLFFALQRHEEQDSEQPVSELLEDILRNTVPEDSLARRGERQTVTVTTPQGLIGREFSLVAVVGVQDGSWPNLRARGSLLGAAALERWLRGGEALMPSRRETTHDELRLFLHACARARDELLVVAVADEDSHPSPFFGLGSEFRVEGLPSSRLTLRGITAAMRRRAVEAPSDDLAVTSLAALAEAGVGGASPDDWYGVLEPSSTLPLYAQPEGEEPRPVPVSPSQLDKAETCALDWVIGALGGGTGSVQASLGTLVHHALETVTGHDPEQLLDAILAEWKKLPFDAEWESERARRTAAEMAGGLSDYLREFEASGKQLLGRESSFSLRAGRAELRGIADRLELRRTPQGAEITVVDLKTGRTPATKPEAEQHVQLQAYQLGVMLGAFDLGEAAGAGPAGAGPAGAEAACAEPAGAEAIHTAARLLYVHPDAAKGKGYVVREQSGLSDEAREQLIERVAGVADIMAAGEFTARIEHHCSDPHRPGNCRLHIIQAVSHA
ncbi:PD-(D/E)XK nuclease family protein [Leucobacter albus]|uniref:DNA 3'-5' helicase n=1 Tax=Leucobacter albus TaxID=272210 RepID=A0ABW3TLI2_9MICO